MVNPTGLAPNNSEIRRPAFLSFMIHKKMVDPTGLEPVTLRM